VLSLWYLYWAGAIMWSLSRAPLSQALFAEVKARNLRIFPWRPAETYPVLPSNLSHRELPRL
jgi:hypothetical protein